MNTFGQPATLWMATNSYLVYRTLQTDVCVVAAGIVDLRDAVQRTNVPYYLILQTSALWRRFRFHFG